MRRAPIQWMPPPVNKSPGLWRRHSSPLHYGNGFLRGLPSGKTSASTYTASSGHCNHLQHKDHLFTNKTGKQSCAFLDCLRKELDRRKRSIISVSTKGLKIALGFILHLSPTALLLISKFALGEMGRRNRGWGGSPVWKACFTHRRTGGQEEGFSLPLHQFPQQQMRGLKGLLGGVK